MISNLRTLYGSQFWTPDFPLYVTRERESFHLPLHDHDFIEIQYVAEGIGSHYIGEEWLAVSKGDWFIIPIGVSHVYRPRSTSAADELIVYNCLFTPELLQALRTPYALPDSIHDWLLAEANSQSYRHYHDPLREGHHYMEDLHREFRMEQPGRRSALSALLIRMLVHLLRLEQQPDRQQPRRGRLDRVLAYLDEQSAAQPTLQEAAALQQISPGHLQQLLKQATGQTFTEYLQNLRIRKSQELLQTSNLTIKDIAERVGYSDLKFFYGLFRKKTGTTPGQCRQHPASSHE